MGKLLILITFGFLFITMDSNMLIHWEVSVVGFELIISRSDETLNFAGKLMFLKA